MSSSRQVITAAALIKNFRKLAARLRDEPQPLLITQKGKDPLVLVNADMFEELLEFRHQAMTAGVTPSISWEEEG